MCFMSEVVVFYDYLHFLVVFDFVVELYPIYIILKTIFKLQLNSYSIFKIQIVINK
ncbi:hypothetical protein Hanom_Chr04g00353681 [Helianthus anomalus]